MDILFNLLLGFVAITGFVSGCIFFLFEVSEVIDSRFIKWPLLILAVIWIISPVIILISWLGADLKFFLHLEMLIIVTAFFMLCSVFSALGSRMVVRELERNLQKKRSFLLYFNRLLLLAYGVICMSLCSSMIKSFSYTIDFADYELEGVDHPENENVENEEIKNLESFLSDLNLIEEQSLLIESNTFSFLSGNYIIPLREEFGFKLEYKSLHAKYNSIHHLYYIPLSNYKEELSIIIGSGSVPDSISVSEIRNKVLKQINEYGLIDEWANRKPISIIDFAYSSFFQVIKLNKYTIKPNDEAAENLDQYLPWIFILVTAVIFFEYERRMETKVE